MKATAAHTAAAKAAGGSSGQSSAADAARLKKERRNERDRQRSFLKRESVNEMKKIVEELEAQKRQLLVRSAAASAPNTSTSTSNAASPPFRDTQEHASSPGGVRSHQVLSSLPPAPSSSSAVPVIRREDFVQLTEKIEQLRLANAALARDLHERDLFNSAMQHLLLDFDRDLHEEHASEAELRHPQQHRHQPERIGFTPLTQDEVTAFTEQTLRQYCNARLDHEAEGHYKTTARVFGWSDFRARVGSTITFSVKKRISNAEPVDLFASIWDFVTDSAKLARLLPADIKCELRVLQRVSENMLILDRRTSHTGNSDQLQSSNPRPVLRTVLAVFKVHDFADSSDVVIMKTVDAPLVKKLLLHDEVWCDIFYYWRFEAQQRGVQSSSQSRHRQMTRDDDDDDDEGDDTLVEFGGILTYVREEFAVAWLVELLFLAVRWESMAVRPVLLKTS